MLILRTQVLVLVSNPRETLLMACVVVDKPERELLIGQAVTTGIVVKRRSRNDSVRRGNYISAVSCPIFGPLMRPFRRLGLATLP